MIVRYNKNGRIVGTASDNADPAIFPQDTINVPDSINTKNKRVDADSETLIWDLTVSEAKSNKITQIKEQANSILSETDWYVVRKQETGEPIPQSVIDHRAKVRSLSDEFESDVTALESVSEVQEYSFEYPDPPEP